MNILAIDEKMGSDGLTFRIKCADLELAKASPRPQTLSVDIEELDRVQVSKGSKASKLEKVKKTAQATFSGFFCWYTEPLTVPRELVAMQVTVSDGSERGKQLFKLQPAPAKPGASGPETLAIEDDGPLQKADANWRNLLPVRKGTQTARAGAKFSWSASSTVDKAVGDPAEAVKAIVAARGKIPPRAFSPQGGLGNAYFRDGFGGSIAKDASPAATQSRAFTGPPTGVDAGDKLWAVFQALFPLEGLPTTLTALVVDDTLTVGAGFSTAGGGPQRILDDLFTRAESNPAVAHLRQSALAAGLALEGPAGQRQLFAADVTTDPANPCQLTGNDAVNYVNTCLPLMSFIANLGIGAQTDLTADPAPALDPAGDAAKAQRQLMLDCQWAEALSHALKAPLPDVPTETAVVVAHARHAGHFPLDWDGAGATTEAEAGNKIWEHLKSHEGGDTSSGSDGGAKGGPLTCTRVSRAVVNLIPKALASIKKKVDAEVNDYDWNKDKPAEGKKVTWK